METRVHAANGGVNLERPAGHPFKELKGLFPRTSARDRFFECARVLFRLLR